MSTARVGIDLDLMNGDEVFNEIKQIERALRSLSGGKNRVEIKSNIAKLREELEALKADKATIRINTKEADARINKLKKSIAQLNKMVSTRKNLLGKPMSPGQIRKVQSALKGMNNELKQMQARKLNLGNEFRRVSVEAQAARQQIDAMNRALANVKPLKEYFNSATVKASHLGSALQSLGSAMGRLSMPVRMLTGGTVLAGLYKFMSMAGEGLSSSVERYDTMENYAKSMAALGEDANKKFVIGTGKAMTAVENLNEAVLGLPTGLNEIVDMQKRFYSASNDMQKSTKMAIATNNAFLASGTEASEKLFGERQLRNLMSVGKLTATQWQSLTRTMPLAMDVVAKELGYADKGVNAMTQDINNGTLSVEKFLDAFTRLGTSGTIADAANVMKHSFQGVQANITNAFSRMGYNLIKTFDEIFQKAYGKDTIDMLYSFRDVIDKASEGIQNWIKSDPDFFIDAIERLKAIDWKGFAKGFGEGMKTMVNWGLKFLEMADKFGAEKIGKFMALSGMIGNILTITGGLIRGGRFGAGLGVVGAVGLVRLLKNLGMLDGIGGKMKDIFKNITGLGKEAAKAEKATKGGKALGSIKGNLAKWAKPLAGIGSVLAIIAGTAGTIMISVKSIKTAIKDMGEISSDFYAVDWGVMAKVGAGFSAFVGGFVGLGKLASKDLKVTGMTALGTAIVGGITTMVAGFGRLDIKLVKDSIKDMVTITNDVKTLGENLKALKGAKFDKGSAKNLASQIYGVYEAMFNRGGNSLSDIKKRDVKKAQDAIKSMKGIFTTLKDIADIMPSLYSSLTKAGVQGSDTMGRGATPFTNFKGQIQSLFTGLNGIMESLNTDLLGEGQFDAKAIGRFESIMSSVQKMFNSINRIAVLLPKIQTNFSGMMASPGNAGRGRTPFNGLVDNIKSMMAGVGSIAKQLQVDTAGVDVGSIEGKLESLANGVNSIKKIANRLSKLGGKGGGLAKWGKGSGAYNAIGNIRKMISSLNRALGDADLGGLKAKVESFVSSVKSLLKQLNNLGGEGGNVINVTVTIKGTVKGQKAVIAKINKAIASIKAACKPKTFTKHVYINIQRHVNIGGDAIPSSSSVAGGGGGGNSGGHVHRHTGGYIGGNGILYRAKGGSIFKPKGTDTVPAMLTQGEYVHKKSAVDFWGVRFMQKINNLDINGAMRELSARANHYMNINRGTTINNNTTNNTDFTQNVYTSNPNFAFRRSSRYVGAL